MKRDWSPDFYKTGYEGFERAANFPTGESLEAYRAMLLAKTEQQVEFLVHHLPDRKLRVLEVGSGNGRLLVSLALRNQLEYGCGIEIAQSRSEFAERWVRDLGLKNIDNVCADVLTADVFERGGFDLAVCITGAFGYFRPIRETAPSELLTRMGQALRPQAQLLLELYQLPRERLQMLELCNNRLRTWLPLPPEDRFAYYLEDSEYWPAIRTLKHGKVFIGRDGVIDAGREEVLSYYRAVEMTELLAATGFQIDKVVADFAEHPYDEGDSPSMVILAQAKLTR